MVTEAAAVTSGNLSLKSGQTNVSSTKCMTKTDAVTRYQVDSGAMSAYAGNQLPPSEVWMPISCTFTADFIDQANQPAPTCVDRVITFQICNSNAAADDMDGALELAARDPAADGSARERTIGAGEAFFWLGLCMLLVRKDGDDVKTGGL